MRRSFTPLEELAHFAQQIAELSTPTIRIVTEEGGKLNRGKAEARWYQQHSWDVADVAADADAMWDIDTTGDGSAE